MDRAEATQIVKEAFSAYESDYRCIGENAKWDNIHEALDLAIEALQEKLQLSGETSTNTPTNISTNEGGAESAMTTDEDMGEVSDGYHTFNQLYHQRAVLFATIVNQNKDKAWKSWRHEDGKFCFDKGGEWFIVGVDTPEGSYTYHYEKKYWDMFDCEELDGGKHWDGHTEEDVTRLLSLPPVTPAERTGEWEEVQGCKSYLCCSECGRFVNVAHKCNFCPNCGAKMGGDTE